MKDATLIIFFILLLASSFGLAGLAFRLRKDIKNKESDLIKEKEESTRRLYEVSILKEIGERVGYSLDVEEILQIITGSLHQFIDYSVVSYIVILPDKLKLNSHLEQSVDHDFLKDLKRRMIASLSALTEKDFNSRPIEETVSGAISIDSVVRPIGSFFNIPLVIGGTLQGLLTIAHLEKGLYKEADMTILYKITSQASQAVSRLQEVVKLEKGKLNSMVESMGDGVLMVDQEYRIVVANPAIKKIIVFNQDRDVSIFDFIDALGGKFDIRGRLEEAIERGSIHISGRKQIEETFFEIGVYPVRHSSLGVEKVFGAVVVFHNITKEIELEKVREDFTSMIVHELRSPLDGMRKIVELITTKKVKPASKDFSDYIKMVYQSSTSMLELVNDILDFSKLQAGKFEIHKEDASLKDTIENRIEFYKVSADTKKIKLSSFLDESLPAISKFDQNSIKQVLNNFISNSLKFTPEGGEIQAISFLSDSSSVIPDKVKTTLNTFPAKIREEFVNSFKIDKKSIVIALFDSGIGIPQNKLKDLFLKYKQASGSPIYTEEKGTGLGLVIAKGIVEGHGGLIEVMSVEKQGSCFYFTLPLA